MNKAQTLNTIFGPLMVIYTLVFADNGTTACDDEFADVDTARDVAWGISAETNSRINIVECFGLSEHTIETILA